MKAIVQKWTIRGSSESAYKHGLSEEDIRHAIAYNILAFDFDEKYKIILAYVGPSLAANLIEVFVDTDNPQEDVVFHAQRLTRVIEQEIRKILGGDGSEKR